MFLVVGNVAMPEDDNTRQGKFSPRRTRPVPRLIQNMNDPDATIAHHDFALDRQLLYYLVALNIALHGHDGRKRLQLGENRQHREITSVNNEFNADKMPPDIVRQLLELRNMGV